MLFRVLVFLFVLICGCQKHSQPVYHDSHTGLFGARIEDSVHLKFYPRTDQVGPWLIWEVNTQAVDVVPPPAFLGVVGESPAVVPIESLKWGWRGWHCFRVTSASRSIVGQLEVQIGPDMRFESYSPPAYREYEPFFTGRADYGPVYMGFDEYDKNKAYQERIGKR